MLTVETVLPSGPAKGELKVVRSARARHMRLMINPRDGTVRLTLPGRASLTEALRWAESKRNWIEGQLAALPAAQPIVPGMILPVAGESLRLDWAESHSRKPARIGDAVRFGGPREMLARRVLRWLRAEAQAILEAETREAAARIGVTVRQIRVGDPVSRWGSCAPSGDIRYSWRLILAPAHVRRATVAHEVAHRVHMDHSARFHALVEVLHGESPAVARRWLRTHGRQLHGFGRSSGGSSSDGRSPL